ncbi:MAG: AAA family ATPase [Methylobacter sp.]|uniref:AAA family ATPase n=1 Tax=Methylobacter sp. TaxID=2051955 RepID=UPI0025F4E7B5|nr:AAA family ATPase [Methylobacter sp.]MCK9620609.1 AAA family ATPase [Methylobacter sp.]
MNKITENKINLVLIGTDELAIKKQLSILSYAENIKNKVVCNKAIIDSINKYAQDENNIIIINLTENGLKELQVLNNVAGKKASIIIIGDQKNIELLSLAIRAGVKDFIDYKNYEEKLNGVFVNIKKNITNIHNNNTKRLNAVINAKGGSGASFIASNVAYVLSKETDEKVALVDLDLQFGAVGLNFDRVPKYTIMDALNATEDLDSVSLEAYMSKYNDNLSLLLPSPSDILLPGEINVSSLKGVLELLQINYSQIVIDLPRLIDPVSSMIMEQADQITLVIQQSLAQFRDGRRLVQILNKDLDIPLDRISIVANRYDPKNSLRIDDLKNLVNHDKVYIIANDFERVANASNLGVPLYESSTNSKIAHDLKELAKILGKVEFEGERKHLLSRFRTFLS